MRILIIEPHASGHHASYLHWLITACLAKHGQAAVATNPPVLAHPLIAPLAARGGSGVEFFEMRSFSVTARASNGRCSLLKRELGYWRALKKAVRDVRADTTVDAVILPYLDYCFYAIALLGAPVMGLPWCGISMRLSVERTSARMPRKWRMAQRMLSDRMCQSLFVINPSVRDIPPEWLPAALAPKVRYLPDPGQLGDIGARDEAKATLGVSAAGPTILVFGSIDERKGVDLLLAAIASADDLRDCVVILAGLQSEGVRALMHTAGPLRLQAAGRVVVLDSYLEEQDQTRVFAAADLVWVGYRGHVHMSGVLVLAGKAGLPALGTPQGEIGRLIGDHALGAVARSESPEAVAEALRSLLAPEARSAAGRRINEFFSSHTVENFGNTVLSAFDPKRV